MSSETFEFVITAAAAGMTKEDADYRKAILIHHRIAIAR